MDKLVYLYQGIHAFQTGNQRSLPASVPDKMPPWSAAVRLLRSVPPRTDQSGGPEEAVYESTNAWEKRGWYWRIGRSLLKSSTRRYRA